jgi:hypothetical protein
MRELKRSPRKLGLLVLPLLAASGCDDEATVLGPTTTENAPNTPATPADAQHDDPLYVIQSLIFGDEGSFSYVVLRPEIAAGPDVALDEAREFPEYSPADPVGGKLAIASGEAPTLTFFSIDDDGVWSEDAQLSFANFTTQSLAGNVPVSPTKAYVPFDTTNHARYDLETFSIGGEVGAPSDIPLMRDGLTANRGFGQELRGTTLFQPYYYADMAFQSYTRESFIAVIDTETDSVGPSLEVPCPHLHITSADDEGNLYFSNGQGSIAAAVLTPGHAPNCFARINAGETTVDPSSIRLFRDLAEGREGSNLFYLGEGKALFNVYHAERDNLSEQTEYGAVDFSSSYHLWTLDLATGQSAMLEGIDFAGGQFTALRLDGRTIITIPEPDYSSTAFYEVTPAGGASKLFEVEGWAFKTFRLR